MNEAVEIDYVLVANHVELSNGLLYINGGGWTDLIRSTLYNQTSLNSFGVAFSICIPWEETSKLHSLSIRLTNQAEDVVLGESHAQINIGRPPTLPEGSEQHVAGAVAFQTVFPSPGTYQVIATVDNSATKRWRFRLHDAPVGT